MACGSCGGGVAQPSPANSVYYIQFSDNSRSAAYPDEVSATIALARSGKKGTVKPRAKV